MLRYFTYATVALTASMLIACDGGTRRSGSSPTNQNTMPRPDTGVKADARTSSTADASMGQDASTPQDGGTPIDAGMLPGDAGPNERPTVMITAPTEGATVQNTVSVTATAMDDGAVAQVEFFIDAASIGVDSAAPFEASWDTTAHLNGNYLITARATDTRGAFGEHTISVNVQNTGMGGDQLPSVNLIYPVDRATVCGAITVEAAASDDNGVTRVEVQVDGQSVGTVTASPFRVSWPTTLTSDGDHVVTAIATDTIGQRAQHRITVTVFNAGGNCDNLPTVSITEPANDFLNNTMVNVVASASDDVGVVRVQFFVDNGLVSEDSSAPYSATILATDFAEGPHTIKAIAYDTANQNSQAIKQIVLDRTDPTITLTEPTNNSIVNTPTFTIRANATDTHGIAQVQFDMDGSTVATLTASPFSIDIMNATPGGHQVAVTVTDRAGNTDSDSSQFTIDALPTVSFTSPANMSTVQGDVQLTVNAADDIGIARVEFFANGTSLGADTSAPYTRTWNTLAAPNGAYTLLAVATDTRGQTASAMVMVTVGDMPPIVAITSPAANANVAGIVTISANASDDVAVTQVQFLVDGSVIGTDTGAPYSATWDTGTSAAGAHTVEAIATDSRGQTTSTTVMVNVNDLPPVVTITAPAANASVSGTVNITANATDDIGITAVAISVDGTTLRTFAAAPYAVAWDTLQATAGQHTIQVVASDTRNQSTTRTIMVTVSDAPPTIRWLAPAANANVTGTVNLSMAATDDLGVVRVDVTDNGAPVGSDTSFPYALSWDTRNVATGLHILAATSVDTRGQTTTANLNVTVVDQLPTVLITAPSSGANVSGDVTIRATATDDFGVASVRFRAAGFTLGTDTTAPYTQTWDTCGRVDGSTSIEVTATDSRGQTNSGTINVMVNNASSPPTVTGQPGLEVNQGVSVLSWQMSCEPSAATSFNLYWSNSPGVTTSSNLLANITGRSYVHTGRTVGVPTYYRIAAVFNGTAGPLSTEINVSLVTTTEIEPNGTAAQAQDVGGAGRVAATVATDGELDYFMVTVPEGGNIYAEISDGAGGCSTDGVLTVFDTDGTTQLGFTTFGGPITGNATCPEIDPRSEIYAADLPAGDYFVERSGINLGTGPYTMLIGASGPRCGNQIIEPRGNNETCDDGNTTSGDGCSATCLWEFVRESEPNGATGSADASAALPGIEITVQGALTPTGDDDVWAVAVPAGGHLRINIGERHLFQCRERIGFSLDLIDTDGTTVLVTDLQSSTSEFCPQISPTSDSAATNMDGGTYYIRVRESGEDAQILHYFLRLEVTAPSCGNGFVEPGEQCDDDNQASGDGCNSSCEIEVSHVISPPGAVVPVLFSNGIRTRYYRIDLSTLGQSITATAADDDGITCSQRTQLVLISPTFQELGDDFSDGPGLCPALHVPRDAFTTDLQDASYYLRVRNLGVSTGSTTLTVGVLEPGCGNGRVEASINEQCDDGNTMSGDGCSSSCTVETLGAVNLPGMPVIFAGAIDPTDEVDYYTLVVTSTAYVRAETFAPTVVSGLCSGTDTRIRLYDDTLTELGDDDFDGVNSCSLIRPQFDAFTRLNPGVYFLSVEEDGMNQLIAAYEVQIEGITADVCGNGIPEVGAGESCDDGNTMAGDGCSDICESENLVILETEPNDTVAQANDAMRTGVGQSTVRGAILVSGDGDYWRFTVPAGQTLDLTARTYTTEGDPNACATGTDTLIELRDSAGTLITSDDDRGPGLCSLLPAAGLTAGTYYINARAYSTRTFPLYFLDIILTQ